MGESWVSQRQIPCLWVVLYIIGTLIGCMQDSIVPQEPVSDLRVTVEYRVDRYCVYG